MPRRSAPTALRLHQGPLPTRGDPRHILPQPPCPSLAPSKQILLRVDLPTAPSRTAQLASTHAIPEYTSTIDLVRVSSVVAPTNAFVSIDFADPHKTKLQGPWDRARSFFGFGIGAGQYQDYSESISDVSSQGSESARSSNDDHGPWKLAKPAPAIITPPKRIVQLPSPNRTW